MLYPTILTAFLAVETLGFSRFSISPARISQHSPCLMSSKKSESIRKLTTLMGGKSDNTIIDNKSNTAVRATRFQRTRRDFFQIFLFGLLTTLFGSAPKNVSAFSSVSPSSSATQSVIAYRTFALSVPEFRVNVPVSLWYPATDSRATDPSKPLPSEIKYEYKISLRRIGQLLAKWEFIPEFVSKDFSLTPSASTSSAIRVMDGKNIPISCTDNKRTSDESRKCGTKVVFLAHGFLGSRSDLGYIAEDLASQGFICVAPEYPESLEASYPRLEGLDRAAINKQLIPYVKEIVPQPIDSYSAIGHSLGCGTVLQMGDDSWNRVLMGSGRAPRSPGGKRKPSDGDEVYKNPVVGGRLLFISSVNDGPVTSWGGGIEIPEEYTVLEENELQENGGTISQSKKLKRAALIFRGENAPNHISYLSENVNDAMLSFLSPLLPVTKTLSIPVLDFDKYADSRDSVATGRVLKPLISSFLAETS